LARGSSRKKTPATSVSTTRVAKKGMKPRHVRRMNGASASIRGTERYTTASQGTNGRSVSQEKWKPGPGSRVLASRLAPP
jgi:hypothetical protein